MKGERYAWHQVAAHLGIPVEELKCRITFTEFLDWVEYIKREEKRRTKLDGYLAQIAAEIRRMFVKNPKSVRLQDMYLTETPEEELAARTARSKSFWNGLAYQTPPKRKKK